MQGIVVHHVEAVARQPLARRGIAAIDMLDQRRQAFVFRPGKGAFVMLG